MARLRTHYDNLKVARDAPPEVIRAAYRTLSQRFHPDRNPGNPDAERIMKIINTAYEVLSDPVRRRAHDEWIAKQEAAMRAAAAAHEPIRSDPRPAEPTQPPPAPPDVGQIILKVLSHLLRKWFWYVFAGLMIWLWTQEENPRPGPKPYQSTPPAEPSPAPQKFGRAPVSGYVRPALAPNGRPWPSVASYLNDVPYLNTDGLSRVTVDNSRNSSDVFVKLTYLDGVIAYPVRQFYIPAGSQFTVMNVRAGNYDIRYRDLTTGGLARSEPFTLTETHHPDSIEYSDFTLTLYKVAHGNTRTYPLAESEF